MIHPTKTDFELMTKQKEEKTNFFLHAQYTQLLPQLLDRLETRQKK